LGHNLISPSFCVHRVAAKLAPEDPEIAFNLASILEACQYCPLLGQSALTPQTVERLPEALEYYKRSKRLGIDRAAVHIKDVSTPTITAQLAVDMRTPHLHLLGFNKDRKTTRRGE
jgi:hypothetical protein